MDYCAAWRATVNPQSRRTVVFVHVSDLLLLNPENSFRGSSGDQAVHRTNKALGVHQAPKKCQLPHMASKDLRALTAASLSSPFLCPFLSPPWPSFRSWNKSTSSPLTTFSKCCFPYTECYILLTPPLMFQHKCLLFGDVFTNTLL